MINTHPLCAPLSQRVDSWDAIISRETRRPHPALAPMLVAWHQSSRGSSIYRPIFHHVWSGGLSPGPLGHRRRHCHCAIACMFACVTCPHRGQTSTKLVGSRLGIARFLWEARELHLRVSRPTDTCHGQRLDHTRLGARATPTPTGHRRLLRQGLTSPRNLSGWAGCRGAGKSLGPHHGRGPLWRLYRRALGHFM